MSHLDNIKTYLNYIHPLSDEVYQHFISLFEEKDYPKGTYFAEEDKYEGKFGLLTKGVTRAFFRNQDGIEYNKTFDVPLAIIGAYSSLVTGQKNLINIQVLTDATILVADYSSIIRLYDQYPSLERFSRKLSEGYFVAKEKREIELVLLDADARYEIFKNDFPNLEQLIPQYHIASYLGITPTQLSRIRKKLAS